jgi:hypothetical protein
MSVFQNQLGQLLHEAGWLPCDKRIDFPRGGDLFPSIQAAWESFEIASLPSNARRRSQRMESWLEEQIKTGAQLTSLSSESPRATHWLGERLLWWPHGRLLGSRIGIASSRLGRRLDTQSDWFTVFRAAYSKINRDQDVLLTAAATTPDRYVRRAAELFGVRVVSMSCPRESEPIHAWFKRIRQLNAKPSETVRQAYLSPELVPRPDSSAKQVALGDLPLRDRAVVSMAERLLVFNLRAGGHLKKLVRARLNDPVWPPASVFIALGEDLVDRETAGAFLDRGAVGWVVLNTLRHESASPNTSPTIAGAPIVGLPSSENWRWLTHCTRSQSNGWPDQSQVEYLDELLLNSNTADRSALAAVQRIIATQRLVATSRLIRGDTDVVCFTAVSLRDLPKLRTFRSHLARWDFEPYGICICQDWLADRSCVPVHYGDESVWESLANEDRPLFQARTSRSHRSGRVIDWSIEREWRHVGDVDLRELPSEAGLIFVPTQEEAEQLAAISRWPITVLA